MKYLVTKDKIKRFSFLKKEIIFNCFKLIKKNKKINQSIRLNTNFIFFGINTQKFKTKIVNRCIISGRQKGVVTKFKLSRIIFANFINSGKLFGIKNYS
jgi:ribosomal protein S14